MTNSGVRDALLTVVAVVPGEDQDDRAGRSGGRAARTAGSVRGHW